MLEVLANIIDAIVWAAMWASFWFLIAALCVLALAGLACLLRPFGLVLAFIWNVAADIVRIVRDTPARSSPPGH